MSQRQYAYPNLPHVRSTTFRFRIGELRGSLWLKLVILHNQLAFKHHRHAYRLWIGDGFICLVEVRICFWRCTSQVTGKVILFREHECIHSISEVLLTKLSAQFMETLLRTAGFEDAVQCSTKSALEVRTCRMRYYHQILEDKESIEN